jgi:TetR/AcrR family transcriptional regulator
MFVPVDYYVSGYLYKEQMMRSDEENSMAETGGRGGRARDAGRTREAILDAAEAVFAQHGFDGARIDAIANASGYNTGLLFRYFGDKLGLYAEVLKRVDREMSELLARAFAPLLEDEAIASDAHRFRVFLTTTFGALFDYMVEHPHVTRMFNWEQAEGWESFARIASQFEPADLARLETLFSRASRAGLLRADLDVVVMVVLVAQICWSSPNTLPLYQLLITGRDFSSATALAHIREQIIGFLVTGVMGSSGERNLD